MNLTQETSRLAYDQIKLQISARQVEVLSAIDTFGPMTNMEIAEKLGWTINTVTPRTNELVKKHMMVEVDRRHCSVTGRMAIVWDRLKLTLF